MAVDKACKLAAGACVLTVSDSFLVLKINGPTFVTTFGKAAMLDELRKLRRDIASLIIALQDYV